MSGPYAGERVELSAELVEYYRRMLVTHSDDPVLGGCRICGKRRCPDWQLARSLLTSAGELGVGDPARVVPLGVSAPADTAQASEMEPGLVVAAQKAVAAHAPERWPRAVYCRNCHARWPCPICRWGAGVLHAAGWSADDLVELRRRIRSGEQPWADDVSTGVTPRDGYRLPGEVS